MVVTIVVLLILAGVSISLILDNNGIIKKSKDARREYRQAQTNEQADLSNLSNWIDDATAEKVEPENIADWEYTEEDDGTITINTYKGNDTTVIIPSYINGKPVKKIESDNYGDRYNIYQTSIWDNSICSKNKSTYWYPQETIKNVIISEGIEIIGRFAFMYSNALEDVTIPKSIKNIHSYALSCQNLTTVYYSGTEESWNKIEIDSSNDILINAERIYNN